MSRLVFNYTLPRCNYYITKTTAKKKKEIISKNREIPYTLMGEKFYLNVI